MDKMCAFSAFLSLPYTQEKSLRSHQTQQAVIFCDCGIPSVSTLALLCTVHTILNTNKQTKINATTDDDEDNGNGGSDGGNDGTYRTISKECSKSRKKKKKKKKNKHEKRVEILLKHIG